MNRLFALESYIAVILVMTICMAGCGNTSLESDMAKETNEADFATHTEHQQDLPTSDYAKYSYDVNGRHISFSAPAGLRPHDPVDALYVHNQEYYMENNGVLESAYMNVTVSEPAYEESLSIKSERTAEEYLSRLVERGADYVGGNQTNTIAKDVTFGGYSGYYYAYEYSDYAPKGTHNLNTGYSLFKGDEQVQIYVSYFGTERRASEEAIIRDVVIDE